VKCDGSRRLTKENAANLFHHFAFGQQLQDLTVPSGQLVFHFRQLLMSATAIN
jgi:hypothetical protein